MENKKKKIESFLQNEKNYAEYSEILEFLKNPKDPNLIPNQVTKNEIG